MAKIPEYWLIGRTKARELEGYTPMEALKLAIEDWNEQEKLSETFNECERGKHGRQNS